MQESWQEWLYPLGLISSVAFTLRFLVQWIASEKAHASIVNKPFWWLSLAGNLTLGIHSFIQAQFHVFLVQVINSIISCRNLNLMEPKEFHWKRRYVALSLALGVIGSFCLFHFASFEQWMRIPTHPFQKQALSLNFLWQSIGIAGVILFASRFWIQWLQSERIDSSTLSRSFWWISLTGALFSLVYFAKISDYINLIGPLFGLIPYCRNLILMRRT